MRLIPLKFLSLYVDIDARQGKKVAGKIRGGRAAKEWGDPNMMKATRLPEATVALLDDLAHNHKLYVWQVLVEAVDLFKAQHRLKPDKECKTR